MYISSADTNLIFKLNAYEYASTILFLMYGINGLKLPRPHRRKRCFLKRADAQTDNRTGPPASPSHRYVAERLSAQRQRPLFYVFLRNACGKFEYSGTFTIVKPPAALQREISVEHSTSERLYEWGLE